jgi:DNA-binding CsgD family transcriptional regulator
MFEHPYHVVHLATSILYGLRCLGYSGGAGGIAPNLALWVRGNNALHELLHPESFRKASERVITLGDALSAVKPEPFVGRDDELQRFLGWLGERDRTPEILNVCGPAGIGKSALLRAFRRAALGLGRAVLFFDCHETDDAPLALLEAFKHGTDEPPVVSLSCYGLVVLDGVKAQSRLSQYLLTLFLPCLDAGTSVVIASREALGAHGPEGDQWRPKTQPMALGGLTEAAARELLTMCGLPEGETQAALVRQTYGNPLALSLAASVARAQGLADVARSLEWPRIVQTLAARLLDEIDEPELRPVVSACAVIGQFDESVLAAVSRRTDSAAIFDRLCRLSIVRPTRRGLMIVPGVRHILAQDLRWRRPTEYRALRQSARTQPASTHLVEVTQATLPRRVVSQQYLRPVASDDVSHNAIVQLTPREREVIELIVAGLTSNREIAAKLVISLGTANLHVKHILHKLGFGNRTELAMWWIQRGHGRLQVS